jgi:hypothetical protein
MPPRIPIQSIGRFHRNNNLLTHYNYIGSNTTPHTTVGVEVRTPSIINIEDVIDDEVIDDEGSIPTSNKKSKLKNISITIDTSLPINDIIQQALSTIFKNKFKINVAKVPSIYCKNRFACDFNKIESFEKNWKKYHKKLNLKSEWLLQSFYYETKNYTIKGISKNKQDVICQIGSTIKSFTPSDIIYIMETNTEGED